MFSTASDNQPSVDIHVLQGEREMARDNRTLGKFQLHEIPPAPRGVPQIEVTFEIDANGIVQVLAKDLKTNKEQKIRIEAGSALSDKDIENMVKDAELHAEEDKKAKESAQAYNELDSLIYQVEKTVNDAKGIDESIKGEINKVIVDAKDALQSRELTKMKSAQNDLNAVLTKYSQQFAQAAQAQPGQEASQPNDNQRQANSEGNGNSEKVVEAEFEEVDPDKKS